MRSRRLPHRRHADGTFEALAAGGVDDAVDLMRRIKADFVYEVGVTTASTTPPMSFALRRGVCQDFAHIMISGMRGLGLPAAYVSGYLRTFHAKEDKLEGADAMHAWVLVGCGE
ncbi:MAG: transglutaminase-like domain-containing protein, partial [Xanthobacteraceae bacterium]